MIGEEIIRCPVCNSDKLEPHSNVVDHFGHKDLFSLSICRTCETLITNPRPTEKESITYYISNSYASHGDSQGYIFDKVYQTIQTINFSRKRAVLEKYTLNKNHLDYGCGTGSFITYLQNKGWAATGVEPDDKARSIAIERNQGGNIYPSLDQLDKHLRFSSISLFHVLEHVHQLRETMHIIISLLDKNGTLILALPNYNSLDSHYYKGYWAGLDVPRHLYHFSQKSIEQLAKSFGLNIVATHPMTFDSYYVSLLSEEYKNGSKNYLNAFMHGYKSNQAAKKTNEYSSLIYVLSK
ncbi:MAG: 2-polyprenyl-3-methyl-5-hydroxy-6-metoxy-1,4-benzoquinol methylase [Roseivirga sp.]|jgi:2-polyprenyl-3-methyl-5-hydroxy-6-metoxy-1,4-benzoquinol methylase